jgi:uncharacterized protein
MSKRYLSSKDFPPYIFVPGENPHPKKSGGHMEGEGDPVAPKINPAHPETNEFLRYSLDLYNHGYYWESHVYFEALWNAHGRAGSVADFLKGMIKLGAAGVKINIDQKQSALGHFDRAKELFESVMKAEGPEFLGFNLKTILSQIDSLDATSLKCFEVHPSWE